MNEKNGPPNFPVQSEQIAYRPEELISCGRCARANPPTRLKCFYCAAELEIAPERRAAIVPVLRKLEPWEKGFNLILRPAAAGEDAARELARLLQLEPDAARQVLEAGKALPVARVESGREADILAERLRALGAEISIVADESLAADNPPRRLRGLEFVGDRLILRLFNGDEAIETASRDWRVFVAGAIFEKAVEATEQRKKGESKILDATETASDETLLDIYDGTDAIGYRVLTKGFDFSCLGAEKSLLARENIRRLADKLRRFAPQAKLVDDYLSVRELLGLVWEIDQRRDSKGLRRHGFGRLEFANTLSTSNRRQFTRYSRLQRQIV